MFHWLKETVFPRCLDERGSASAVHTAHSVFKAREEGGSIDFLWISRAQSLSAGLVEFVPLINGSYCAHMGGYCTLL